MQILINICIAFFCFAAILVGLATLVLSLKDYRLRKDRCCKTSSSFGLNYSDDTSNNLNILNYGTSSLEIATAFVALMQCGYITIHKLMNKGNNYNDQMQTDIYNQSLTEKTVIALLDLEAKNGGYSL